MVTLQPECRGKKALALKSQGTQVGNAGEI